jgi:hypothetical protein
VTVYRFDGSDAARIVAVGFAFFASLRIGALIVQAIWFPV